MSQSSVGHGENVTERAAPWGRLRDSVGRSRNWPLSTGEDSIQKLIHLRDHAESEQVQFAATKELLDRAYGRPRQEFDIANDNRVNIIVNRPVLLNLIQRK